MIEAIGWVSSLLCLLPRTGPDAPVDARTRHVIFESGAELIHVGHREGSPWSPFRIGIRFGSALDPPGKSGLARVLGLVLVRAIAEPEDEPRLLARLGGRLEIETGLTSTSLVGGVPSEHIEALMKRLFAALHETRISEDTVKVAIGRALEERLRLRSDDHLLAQIELRRALSGAHPIGTNPWGEVRDLASITRDDVRAFMRRHVGRDAIVAGVASPAGDGLEGALERWMEDLPIRSSLTDPTSQPGRGDAGSADLFASIERTSLRGRRVVLIDRPGRREAVVILGSMFPRTTDDRMPALLAANAVIGASFSSRLTEALGRTHGVAPVALSRIDHHGPAALLSIWLSLEEDKVAVALHRLLEELGKLGSDGPSQDEIGFGRRAAAGRAVLELRDPDHSLRALVRARTLGLPQDAPVKLGSAIANLSDAEVRAAVGALAAAQEAVIVIVARENPALQRALAGLPGVRNVSIVSSDDR